jgi:hypothetical protein
MLKSANQRNLKLVLIGFLSFFGCVSFVSANSTDVIIPAYPHAHLEYQRELSGEEHQFLLSTPKRINNALNIEKEVLLKGVRNNLLLSIKSAGSIKNAFTYYHTLFSEQGEVTYSCEERACGSSNYWANSIFNESKLYGRDSEQYYLAGRLTVDEQRYFVSVYVVTNGRKQQYIYLSYVPEKKQQASVSSAQQVNELARWQQGVLLNKPSLNEEQVAFIEEQLNRDSALSLWVLGFSGQLGGQNVNDSMNLSEKALKAFKVDINGQLSMSDDRIITKNMGPFAIKPTNTKQATWFQLYLLK